jgi:hypothetical protein
MPGTETANAAGHGVAWASPHLNLSCAPWENLMPETKTLRAPHPEFSE